MHTVGMPLDMRIINNVQHRNRQHIKNVTITLASKRAVGGDNRALDWRWSTAPISIHFRSRVLETASRPQQPRPVQYRQPEVPWIEAI
ncbi:hypothetical protein M5D96_004978 [Drosophila gunungcola]|uniref:Uncharacterized protein n=1 Tax=Drosophila gunungcola TaxID=103775 RepID=A0A9P9YUZ9_9MUSC|nr:hypothetical protein M5D96_004978 [Drosophila gunungcola]